MSSSQRSPRMFPAVIEAMEGRCLFSAPAGIPWQDGLAFLPGGSPLPGVPGAPVDASASAGIVQPGGSLTSVPGPVQNVRTTSLIGNWKGKVKGTVALFISKSFKATLNVTAQTDTSLTGVLNVKGHKVDGTFTGYIHTDGSFHYEYKSDDIELKLDGSINYRGDNIAGTADLKYQGFSIGGSFKFHRKLPAALAAAAKAKLK